MLLRLRRLTRDRLEDCGALSESAPSRHQGGLHLRALLSISECQHSITLTMDEFETLVSSVVATSNERLVPVVPGFTVAARSKDGMIREFHVLETTCEIDVFVTGRAWYFV